MGALQMTTVWSCGRLQRRCSTAKYRKIVSCQSSTAKLELRAGAVLSAVPGWQVQRPVAGCGITLFVLVLVRGSVLKIVDSEAVQCNVR